MFKLYRNTGPKTIQTYTFDFFNYAGIHRSVFLYTTPIVYIDDVDIKTDYTEDGVGNVFFSFTGSVKEFKTIYLHIFTIYLGAKKKK